MEIVEKLDSIHKKLDSILFPPIICKKKKKKKKKTKTKNKEKRKQRAWQWTGHLLLSLSFCEFWDGI